MSPSAPPSIVVAFGSGTKKGRGDAHPRSQRVDRFPGPPHRLPARAEASIAERQTHTNTGKRVQGEGREMRLTTIKPTSPSGGKRGGTGSAVLVGFATATVALAAALVLSFAVPASAQSQGEDSAPPPFSCPEGWVAVPPELNPNIRCLPGHVVAGPGGGDAGPPPFSCPEGWVAVPPELNPNIRCLPGHVGAHHGWPTPR